MYFFSDISKERLSLVHQDLHVLFNEVIKYFDCSVIYGIRTTEEQQELYAQGRTKPGYIVTYKDGIINKSKHQEGLAVDVVPYPINWKDRDRLIYFAGFVKGIAKRLKEEGKIKNNIICGIDWDDDTDLSDQSLFDAVHFQIKE